MSADGDAVRDRSGKIGADGLVGFEKMVAVAIAMTLPAEAAVVAAKARTGAGDKEC